MQDVQEVMSETAGNATRGRGEDAWRLEPECETETLETKSFRTWWKASTWTLMVKVNMSGSKSKNPEGKVKHQEKKVKKLRARRGK